MNNKYLSPLRNYRKLESLHEDEQKFQVMVEETDLLITIPKYANMEEAACVCVQYIKRLRQELKEYILINPIFQHSLKPVSSQKNAPNIVKAMCQATKYAHVGPFAAVAGSIAQMTSLMLVAWIRQQNIQINTQINAENQHKLEQEHISSGDKNQGKTQQHIEINKQINSERVFTGQESTQEIQSEIQQITEQVNLDNIGSQNSNPANPINVIVENGGDIYIYSEKERIVSILSNPTEGESIGLKIYPSDCPVSICSSSSKIGHSLSFGNGDIAMVRAKNAALADSLATAYCNILKTSKDINKVIERAQKDAAIQILHNPFNNDELFFLNALHAPHTLNEKNTLPHNDLEKNTSTQNALSGGLEGVFLQCDGHIGAWGKIELVAL